MISVPVMDLRTGTSAAIASLSLVPALFPAHAGWHTGHGRVHACPGVPASRCVQVTSWAATIPWRGCGECFPHRMIGALPRDGTILQVTITAEQPLVARRRLSWPPRIRRTGVKAGVEGVPIRYGVYQVFARFGRVEAYVWAFFGRARPSGEQLNAANAELGRVQLK